MNAMLKYTAVTLYALFLFTFLISIFGRNKIDGPLGALANKTLENTGFSKSRIDSLDNKIDESIYTLDTYAYQISKIRNFFSDDELKPPKKIQHEYIAGSMYYPVINAMVFILRIIVFTASLIFLAGAIIFNLLYKISSLNERLRILERKMKRIEASPLMK
jgi:hypothetical protein